MQCKVHSLSSDELGQSKVNGVHLFASTEMICPSQAEYETKDVMMPENVHNDDNFSY